MKGRDTVKAALWLLPKIRGNDARGRTLVCSDDAAGGLWFNRGRWVR